MFLPVMLLEKFDEPFDDSRWIFEPKIDGHRLVLSHINGTTRLYTRHNNECTRQYPELASIPFMEDLILDCEVAATDASTGTICFESVMERFSASKADKIKKLSQKNPVNLIIFDILFYKGKDLRKLNLLERKEILASISLPNDPHISIIPFFENEGIPLFSKIKAANMEGVCAKLKSSAYSITGTRSSSWLKIINWTRVEIFISGYRKNEFGWLASIKSSDGQLKPVGVIELGVTPIQRKAFYSVKDSLKISEDSDNVYLDPRLKARVKIRNWTKNGMLRTPAFEEFIY
jgi:DNA ligase-1